MNREHMKSFTPSYSIRFSRIGFPVIASVFALADMLLADTKGAPRDLWSHKTLGTFDAKYAAEVPSHGAVLLLVR
jgi:hypothetical protein